MFAITKRLALQLVVVGTLALSVVAQQRNLMPAEILSRHRASLGSTQEMERNRLRAAVGSSKFTMHGTSQRTVHGNAVFASDGRNLALLSTFDMMDYRLERIGLFNNEINIPFVDAGKRSPLGNFLMAYDKLLSNRVLGGAIFSSWLFGSDADLGDRVRNTGKKRLNGREVWVLEYSPKGGLPPGSSIKLFFDAENYHHVRTQYEQKDTDPGFYNTDPGLIRGSTPLGSSIREWTMEMAANGHTLIEDFDEINPVGGVTLPFKYSITLQLDSYKGSAHFDWKFVIREYKLVKDFPPGTFNFKTPPQV